MTHNQENHLRQRLQGLDHLRALAIIFVFLFHYFILSGGQPAWLPDAASFGWTGVDLFFVLSGFLIASQLFGDIKKRQQISFRDFFLKRFFRIVPAYLVTVGLYFYIPFFREKESLPHRREARGRASVSALLKHQTIPAACRSARASTSSAGIWFSQGVATDA